jgi:hypothetical protein
MLVCVWLLRGRITVRKWSTYFSCFTLLGLAKSTAIGLWVICLLDRVLCFHNSSQSSILYFTSLIFCRLIVRSVKLRRQISYIIKPVMVGCFRLYGLLLMKVSHYVIFWVLK